MPEDVKQRAATAIGLTSGEAKRRQAKFGPNAVTSEVREPWRLFLSKFWAPSPWLLETAIVLQLALGEYVEASVIAGLLLFNVGLSFVQESRANGALAVLKSKLELIAMVRRDGAWRRLGAGELVPGDAMRLPLGGLIPADATLLSGSITVDQSMLTGESVPVAVEPGGKVFAGAIVRRGEAIAEVTAIGVATYFGRTAELVRSAHVVSTEQKAIFGATRNLALVNGAVALALLAFGYAIGLPTPELVRLALTALLASIPVALPATFTLSAAMSAQTLARRGVLLTRLSAAHEAATIDVLCADKTGTLTQNALSVDEVAPFAGYDRARVLAFAAAASSEGGQDQIDATIRREAGAAGLDEVGTLRRFVPFDPATQMSEAIVDGASGEVWIVKGAFHAVAKRAQAPPNAHAVADDLAAKGRRVIAVASGPPAALKLIGLIALSDPPREDSAPLIGALTAAGVRVVMITGDSAATAGALARKVGLAEAVCPMDRLADANTLDQYSVFARVLPEQKFALVKALQAQGHVVGMCGDGVNDAPALRQAEIGIAVSSAADVAKAAAAVVLTEPGLRGIVDTIGEGRIAFQRLLAYTLNMLVKKTEIVLFLAIGLLLTGRAVMTPVLMVLLIVTNDFLSMSLTIDRARPSSSPNAWRMNKISTAAVALAACKLGFTIGMLAIGEFLLRLDPARLQTLTFVALAFGNQSLLYALRETRHMWASRPGVWVAAASALDIAVVTALALAGVLMAPLPPQIVAVEFLAAFAFAFLLDQLKLPILSALRIS
ncbi:MAG: HAD-IC family P-type ATPase [Pseudomonadota bacterium]|nr:HAD-IC family P-type ATPase [Pseudomonadota bacterium]